MKTNTHWAFNKQFEDEEHEGHKDDCPKCQAGQTHPVTHIAMHEGIWEEHDGREEDCADCQSGDTVSALDFAGSIDGAAKELGSRGEIDPSMTPDNLRRLARLPS